MHPVCEVSWTNLIKPAMIKHINQCTNWVPPITELHFNCGVMKGHRRVSNLLCPIPVLPPCRGRRLFSLLSPLQKLRQSPYVMPYRKPKHFSSPVEMFLPVQHLSALLMSKLQNQPGYGLEALSEKKSNTQTCWKYRYHLST